MNRVKHEGIFWSVYVTVFMIACGFREGWF